MRKIRGRIVVIFVAIAIVFGFIVHRLVELQYIDAEEYAAKAINQSLSRKTISAVRGQILDSEGDVLAISSDVYRVLAALDTPDPTNIRQSLEVVREVIEFDVDAVVREMLEKGVGNYVVVAPSITKTECDLVSTVLSSQGISNIVTDKQKTRTYPFHSLSSKVVGLTNTEGHGYLGIEFYYDDILSGRDGLEIRTSDARGNPLPYGIHEVDPPVDGEDVYLTTKNALQFFVEETIEKTCRMLGAKSVSVVITNVRDNSVLVMASYPTFNLSDPFGFGDDMDDAKWATLSEQEKTDYYYENRWRNPITSNIYEPGSVFKTLITAIALEEGLVNENTTFFCGGSRQVEDQELKCISYPDCHGTQTLKEAFINSCNVFYMQVTELIGRERLYKHFRRLHLLEPTGIDLPNESAPFYVPERDVGAVELATLGYGHAISVNMLNMISAVSALVNGGYYYPIYIATDADGNPLRADALKGERVFSKATCDIMKDFMEAQSNSVANFHIDGLRIGGKSGTTVKYVDGEYDDMTVISSYIAFAPMDDPLYCVYVLIDEPDVKKHGLATPYPLVKQIFADIFRLYPLKGQTSSVRQIAVPDLVGGTVSWAEEVASWSGLSISTSPSLGEEEDRDAYTVIEQFPEPGTLVKEGFVIILNIEKIEEEQ